MSGIYIKKKTPYHDRKLATQASVFILGLVVSGACAFFMPSAENSTPNFMFFWLFAVSATSGIFSVLIALDLWETWDTREKIRNDVTRHY